MRLQRLTGLEREKLVKEHEQTLRTSSPTSRHPRLRRSACSAIIKDELADVKEKFGDERRTEILGRDGRPHHRGPARRRGHGRHRSRAPATSSARTCEAYRSQKRGGKGVTGMETKEEDFVERPLRRLDPLLPPVLHQQGQGLLAQGARDPRGRRARPRARRSSTCSSARARASAVATCVPVRDFESGGYRALRHQAGQGQEDRAVRVLASRARAASRPSRSRRATR